MGAVGGRRGSQGRCHGHLIPIVFDQLELWQLGEQLVILTYEVGPPLLIVDVSNQVWSSEGTGIVDQYLSAVWELLLDLLE